MTFHPIPLTAMVNMFYSSNGQPCENTYFFKGTAAWTSTLLGNLLTAMYAWENGLPKAQRASTVALVAARATDMSAENSFVVEQSGVVGGTASGSQLPNNVTFSVEMQTGLAGRANRGRTYWLGLTLTMLDGGALSQALTATASNNIIAALNGLLATGITSVNGAALSVAHRRTKAGWLSSGTTNPVIGFTAADLFVDSQRRRLPAHNRRRR